MKHYRKRTLAVACVPPVFADNEGFFFFFFFFKGNSLQLESRKDVDPHLVACVLKQFVRDLQNSLLDSTLVSVWVQAVSIRDDAQRLAALQAVANLLPIANRTMASHLFQFLHSVAGRAGSNKMTASNLAIVFGPNLFHSNSYDLSQAGAVVQLALICIERPMAVFETRDAPASDAQLKKRLDREFRLTLTHASVMVMRSEMGKTDVYDGVVPQEYRPLVNKPKSAYVQFDVDQLAADAAAEAASAAGGAAGGASAGGGSSVTTPRIVANAAAVNSETAQKNADGSGVWRSGANARTPLHALAWSSPGVREWPAESEVRGATGGDESLKMVRIALMSAGMRLLAVCDVRMCVREVMLFVCGVLWKVNAIESDSGRVGLGRYEWAMYKCDSEGVQVRCDNDAPLATVLPPPAVEFPRLVLMREEANSTRMIGDDAVRSRLMQRNDSRPSSGSDSDWSDEAAIANSKPLPIANGNGRVRALAHLSPTSPRPLSINSVQSSAIAIGSQRVMVTRHESAPFLDNSAVSSRAMPPQSAASVAPTSSTSPPPVRSPVRSPRAMSPLGSRSGDSFADVDVRAMSPSGGSMSPGGLHRKKVLMPPPPTSKAPAPKSKQSASPDYKIESSNSSSVGGATVGGKPRSNSISNSSSSPPMSPALSRISESVMDSDVDSATAVDVVASSAPAAPSPLVRASVAGIKPSAARTLSGNKGGGAALHHHQPPSHLSHASGGSSGGSGGSALSSMTLPRALPSQTPEQLKKQLKATALDLERAQYDNQLSDLKFTVDELYELVLNLQADAAQVYISRLPDEVERAAVKAALHSKLMALPDDAVEAADDMDDDSESDI
jgi:hypothetical protein